MADLDEGLIDLLASEDWQVKVRKPMHAGV